MGEKIIRRGYFEGTNTVKLVARYKGSFGYLVKQDRFTKGYLIPKQQIFLSPG